MRAKTMRILERGGESYDGVMMKLLYITPEYFVNSGRLNSLFRSLNEQVVTCGASDR